MASPAPALRLAEEGLVVFAGGSNPCPSYPGLYQDTAMQSAKADCAIYVISPAVPSIFVDSDVVRQYGSAELVSLLRPRSWIAGRNAASTGIAALDEGTRRLLSIEKSMTFAIDLCQERLKGDQLVLYCIAVRNFFAVSYGKPIVGRSLYQALIDVRSLCDNFLTENTRPDTHIWEYVQDLKLDDCRNSLDLATQLLHFSEDTRWEKGYIESFVHCVGMIDRTEAVSHPMFAPLTQQTHQLLRAAHRKQQADIQHLEQLLAGFDFAGGNSSINQNHAAGFRAMKAFQDFLREYYTAKYRRWPPDARHKDHWLTRGVALELQTALGTLYEYLVDQDICWGRSFAPQNDESTEKPSSAGRSVSGTAGSASVPPKPTGLRKPASSAAMRSVTMPVLPSTQPGPSTQPIPSTQPGPSTRPGPSVHPAPQHSQQPREILSLHRLLEGPGERLLAVDTASLHSSSYPIMDLIHRWNKKCGISILPHPFPRIPELRDTYTGSQALLSRAYTTAADTTVERNYILYNDAHRSLTNTPLPAHEMLTAFQKHEATVHLPGVSTHDARLGHWLVVYCAMQLLSRITVDVQGLWYRGGVDYFLNAGLEGCPPWESARLPHTMRAASPSDSHCWLFAHGVRAERRKRAAGFVIQ